MHVRLRRCLGMAVVVSDSQEFLGTLSSAVLHPDMGKVEGFLFRGVGLFPREYCFSSLEVSRWGGRVEIRDGGVTGPLEDFVRLSALLQSGRTILGQRMITETGRMIGWCRDVQFATETFTLEWLFPRRWLRWGIPVPVSAVSEVRSDAIIIRDREVLLKEPLADRTILAQGMAIP